MSVYKRGGVWWYKFKFAGQLIRESTKSTNRNIATAAERTRHAELENGFNRVGKRTRPQLFTVAAAQWLKSKTTLSPRSVKIEQLNLKHLEPVFGNLLLTDITADGIADYQTARKSEGAAPKTINLEFGTLRPSFAKAACGRTSSQM
jgi:Phage integrase, N-terminal SAM-like domain